MVSPYSYYTQTVLKVLPRVLDEPHLATIIQHVLFIDNPPFRGVEFREEPIAEVLLEKLGQVHAARIRHRLLVHDLPAYYEYSGKPELAGQAKRQSEEKLLVLVLAERNQAAMESRVVPRYPMFDEVGVY